MMKILIVGGNFGDEPKASGVVKKIATNFGDNELINGGSMEDLPHNINSDLIIWMPNIKNEIPKQYPRKTNGNVLIVSKVIREGYTELDAVSRIFAMRGNAVIAIYKEDKFRFKLIDALGNVWYDGSYIYDLQEKIIRFYDFTRKAVRVPSTHSTHITPQVVKTDLNEFIEINKGLAEYIQTSCGERFFGNLSTRCVKLFPTMLTDVGMFVSPRNVDKNQITPADMVYCEWGIKGILYKGHRKPSIDSPVQMKVYESCENINYMIHGHAFIKDAVETSEYYLCGDMRESDEVIKIIGKDSGGAINLKNHGFLLYSDTLDKMKSIIKGLEFTYKRKNL